MKRTLYFLAFLVLVSCSSDSTIQEMTNQSDSDSVAEEETNEETDEEEEEDEESQEEETEPRDITYDLSIITRTNEITKEFNVEKGELVNGDNPTDLNASLNLSGYYYFNTDGSTFIAWNFSNGPVWYYDVITKSVKNYSDYFEVPDDFTISSPCTFPINGIIATYFNTENHPVYGNAQQVTLFDTTSEESTTIALPVPYSNCIFGNKIGSSDLIMMSYRIDNDRFWSVLDMNTKEFNESIPFFNSQTPLAINENQVIFFGRSMDQTFWQYSTYDVNNGSMSQSIPLVNSEKSSTTENFFFQSWPGETDAEFEDGNMLFFNFPLGRAIIPTGNNDQAYGPAILNLMSGELRTFSSQKMMEVYTQLDEINRINLKPLQIEIDLQSETIVMTYHDIGYDPSPYGVLIFDFDLNLLKIHDLGNEMPIAMIKYRK